MIQRSKIKEGAGELAEFVTNLELLIKLVMNLTNDLMSLKRKTMG